jgi:hypothetical protein
VGAMFVWLIIENMFRGFLFWQFNETEATSEKVNTFMQFLPLESMTNLIKEPFSRLGAVKSLAGQIGKTFVKTNVEFTTILIVSFWTFVFIYLSFILLKKRDL